MFTLGVSESPVAQIGSISIPRSNDFAVPLTAYRVPSTVMTTEDDSSHERIPLSTVSGHGSMQAAETSRELRLTGQGSGGVVVGAVLVVVVGFFVVVVPSGVAVVVVGFFVVVVTSAVVVGSFAVAEAAADVVESTATVSTFSGSSAMAPATRSTRVRAAKPAVTAVLVLVLQSESHTPTKPMGQHRARDPMITAGCLYQTGATAAACSVARPSGVAGSIGDGC